MSLLLLLKGSAGGGTQPGVRSLLAFWAGGAASVAAGAPVTIAVPAANVTYAGVAPAVKQSHTVVVPAANVTYAGVAPTVFRGAAITIAIPAANVTYAGVAPAVITGGGRVLQVPAANVSYAAPVPTLSQPRSFAIPRANVNYAAPVPAVVQARILRPPAANVTYTGVAPTIARGAATLVAVPAAVVVYNALAPSISIGGVPVAPAVVPGVGGTIGRRRRRARPRNYVEIDGELFEANTEEEAKQLLAKARQLIIDAAKARAREIATPPQKPVRRAKPDQESAPLLALPKVALGGEAMEPLQAEVKNIEADLQEQYAKALVSELRAMHGKLVALQDEVDVLTLLLEDL